jgi:hypothetical protein
MDLAVSSARIAAEDSSTGSLAFVVMAHSGRKEEQVPLCAVVGYLKKQLTQFRRS